MKKFALVTGASSGLGRAIACELARRGVDTLLVALPGEGLGEVCRECRSCGVDSLYFETDLTDPEAPARLAEQIEGRYEIFALFNNAGTGGSCRFDEASHEYVDNIIRLNIAVATSLTHMLLPNLKRNAPSHILNVSSMAALTPCGYKTVYPASKAFIKHFSLGLREELKKSGVSVSLAVLGPMPTRPDIIRRIESQGALGRMLSVSPQKTAQRCVDKTFRRRRIIVVGALNVVSYHLLRLIPEHLRGVLMSRSVRHNELQIK